jgi:hypothetical protein
MRESGRKSKWGANTSDYSQSTMRWEFRHPCTPSEPVEDIEEGKEKAAEYARAYLKCADIDLPPLVWKKARSI